MTTTSPAVAKRIRELNDAFRQTFTGGRVTLTAGVDAQPAATRSQIIARVQAFDAFTVDNDPHGEHDFGSFEFEGEKFFWKIDYYAPDMEHGSEDPSDPNQTTRVLTIMLASEY